MTNNFVQCELKGDYTKSPKKERTALKSLCSPHDVVSFCEPYMRNFEKEHFWALSLNAKNQILRCSEISVGLADAALVHPREVFRVALLSRAISLILVHNHPSGNPKPSRQDIKTTRRLIEAGELLGIPVLDHIVIGATDAWASVLREMKDN